MKTKIKYQRGVTLIALVVTIIVILIISGIVMARIRAKNGLKTNVLKARKVMDISGTVEKIKLCVTGAKTQGLGVVDINTLKTDLSNYIGEEKIDYDLAVHEEGCTLTLPKYDLKYYIGINGNIEEEPISNSDSYMIGFVDEWGTRSTIYLYGNPQKQLSANQNVKVDIKQAPEGSIIEGVNLPAKGNMNTYKPKYSTSLDTNSLNCLVFRVNMNGLYTFDITVDGNTTETKIRVKDIQKFVKADDLQLEYANTEKNAFIYNGAIVPKGYYINTSTTVEKGLVITDSIDSKGYSNGNEWVWVPVNSEIGNNNYYLTINEELLSAETDVTYTKYSNFRWVSSVKPSDSNGNKEPALAPSSSFYVDEKRIYERGTNTEFSDLNGVANQYVRDFESMIQSVDKYGGFYIGRYEISKVDDTAMEQPYEASRAGDWYEFYNKCLTFGNNNIESGMIYGTLWDATLLWLQKSGYNLSSSSSYGRYKDSASELTNENTTIKTNMWTSLKKNNNIFDLAGSCEEWTQECKGDRRIVRGGSDYWKSTQYNIKSRIGRYPTDRCDEPTSVITSVPLY